MSDKVISIIKLVSNIAQIYVDVTHKAEEMKRHATQSIVKMAVGLVMLFVLLLFTWGAALGAIYLALLMASFSALQSILIILGINLLFLIIGLFCFLPQIKKH